MSSKPISKFNFASIDLRIPLPDEKFTCAITRVSLDERILSSGQSVVSVSLSKLSIKETVMKLFDDLIEETHYSKTSDCIHYETDCSDCREYIANYRAQQAKWETEEFPSLDEDEYSINYDINGILVAAEQHSEYRYKYFVTKI